MQSDHLMIADWMILPLGQEHSHGKTQYIPGKQVLVRSRLLRWEYAKNVAELFICIMKQRHSNCLQCGLSMMSQKKPNGIRTKAYSPNHINSSNMNPLQIQKVASPPAIPAGGFLGACSVTSMMVQTTSNGNRTAKQVIKLHLW